MRKLWNVLSFRQRLLLPIAAMIVSALISGGVALLVFSPDQFEYETSRKPDRRAWWRTLSTRL